MPFSLSQRILLVGLLLLSVLAVIANASTTVQSVSATDTCTTPSETTTTTTTTMSADNLPRWDLSRFGFSSPMDPAMDEYVKETGTRAKAFQQTYEGKLGDPSSVSLKAAIGEYEDIAVRRGTVSAYLSLSYDTQLDNDELKKRKGAISQLQSQQYGDHLEWFGLDLAAMEDGILEQHMAKDETLSNKYKAYIDEVRRSRPHNLSKEVERALTVRSPWCGVRPLVSFFDKELSLMRFQLEEEEITMEVLLSKLGSSKDASVRANCLSQLNKGLGGPVGRVAALSLSSVAGAWHIENQERSFQNLRSQRNLENNCPDEVVDSLLQGVRTAGVPLCKRYYTIKKQILKATQGLEQFQWSDRNAPMDLEADNKGKEDDKISWEKAVDMVEKGYRTFSPRMADMFMDMVNEKRIDVPTGPAKKGGAYCSGAVPDIGPFQLLNFDGTKHDVATLAHESGHGCHDILAYKQGYLQYHPPLTLAETASIFGEMIVFRDLLKLADDNPQERLSLLMSKIDDVVNSVVRQCSFDRFEELAHSARANGELTEKELDEFWMQAVTEYYGEKGEVFDSYDNIEHLWAYVPHFHHVPFYVYSYAFADLVVGTLYHSFQTNPKGFEDRLLDLLEAGGTRDFADALQPFGLDPKSPSFWTDALSAHLGGLVSEAEALAKQLGYL